MQAITGIFDERMAAEAATEELVGLLGKDAVHLLTVSSPEEDVEAVPTVGDRSPVGSAVGGVVGGLLGAGLGFFVPGVGQVAAFGALATLALAAGGGVAGYAVGDALEKLRAGGLPERAIPVIEDALRSGKSVVIAVVDTEEGEQAAAHALTRHDGVDLETAREAWWGRVRKTETEAVAEADAEVGVLEEDFRQGFEAALSPSGRQHGYADMAAELERRYPESFNTPAFKLGFQRGKRHQAAHLEQWTPADR